MVVQLFKTVISICTLLYYKIYHLAICLYVIIYYSLFCLVSSRYDYFYHYAVHTDYWRAVPL